MQTYIKEHLITNLVMKYKLILTNNLKTLQDHGIGPFTITQIHTNGTITFQHTPHIGEQINIHRIKPYWH